MKELEPKKLLETTFIIGAIGAISLLAFSKNTREEIHKRDGNQSVWSGKTENLEAAHINHDKKYEHYDDASNGRLLTTGEHLWDHINRHGTEQLGLNDSQNNWSIMMLFKRLNGDK